MAGNAEKQATGICIDGFKLESLKGGFVGYDKRPAKLKLLRKTAEKSEEKESQESEGKKAKPVTGNSLAHHQSAIWTSSQASVSENVRRAPIEKEEHETPDTDTRAHLHQQPSIRKVEDSETIEEPRFKEVKAAPPKPKEVKLPKAVITANKVIQSQALEKAKKTAHQRPMLRIPKLKTKNEEPEVKAEPGAPPPETRPAPEPEKAKAGPRPEIRIPELKAGKTLFENTTQVIEQDQEKEKKTADEIDAESVQEKPEVTPPREEISVPQPHEEPVCEQPPAEGPSVDSVEETAETVAEPLAEEVSHSIEENAAIEEKVKSEESEETLKEEAPEESATEETPEEDAGKIENIEDLTEADIVEKYVPRKETGLQKYLVCRKCGTIIKIYGTNRKARCCKQIMVTLVETAAESRDEKSDA